MQTFNCPTCGAPLEYSSMLGAVIKCQHCGNDVVVPEHLRAPAAEAQDLSTLAAQSEAWGEVARLIRKGQKIEAIKRVRELTGLGLKEAKDAVEELERDRAISLTWVQPGAAATPVSADGEIESYLASLQTFLSSGQKLQAIKELRGRYRLGLKEAKDAVEAWEAGRTAEAAALVAQAQAQAAAAERRTQMAPEQTVEAPPPRRAGRTRGAGLAGLGCLLPVLFGGLLFGVIFWGWPLRTSASFDQALTAAQNDPRVRAGFGGQVERGWGLITGEISCSRRCLANYTIPLQGPAGAGELRVLSNTLEDGQLGGLVEGTWVLNARVITPSGEIIPLGGQPALNLPLATATPSAPQIDATAGAQARATRTAEAALTLAAAAARAETATAVAGAAQVEATATAQTAATAQAVLAGQAAWATTAISETFDLNRNNWPTERFDDGSLVLTPALTDGVYRWGVAPASGGHYWNLLPGAVPPATDFIASVDVRLASGGAGGVYVYGLAFRAEGRDYGLFGLTNAGQARLMAVYGSAIYELYDFSSAAIRTAPGAVNRLTVRAVGPDFVFLINEQVVFAWAQPNLNDGRLGLGVDIGREGTDAVIEFDNFEVITP